MAKKMKFLRTGYHIKSKLGLRRKKKLKYRKATGIDNKIRLKMKGHLRNVNIGYKGDKKNSGKINGLNPILIKNVDELRKLTKDDIGIVAKIGMKKRLSIAREALEKKINLYNLNPQKFIEKAEKEIKLRKEDKKTRQEKKKSEKKKSEKKAKEKEEKEKSETDKKEDKAEKKEDHKKEDKDKKEDKAEKKEDKKEDKEDKAEKKEDKKEDKAEKKEDHKKEKKKKDTNKKSMQQNNYGRGK
jgi:ribosomal protein L32E